METRIENSPSPAGNSGQFNHSERYVVLNIRTLMAKRNVRSVAALQRMLIAAGVDISNQQLNRIVDNRATLLNLNVVNGLLKVLQCSVHELFDEMSVPVRPDTA